MKTRKLLLVALLLAFASVGFGQNTIDHLGKIRMRYNNNGIPDTLTMSFSGDTVKYNANEGFHKFNGGVIADSLKLSGENSWVKELLGGGGSTVIHGSEFINVDTNNTVSVDSMMVGIGLPVYFDSTYVYSFEAGVLSNIEVSSDGKYRIATISSGMDSYIYTSNDYGKTWDRHLELDLTDSHSWKGMRLSYSGKYQILGNNAGSVYVSNDYGNTWELKYGGEYGGNITVAVSGDGKYMLFTCFDNTYKGGYVGLSSNYGENFSQIGNDWGDYISENVNKSDESIRYAYLGSGPSGFGLESGGTSGYYFVPPLPGYSGVGISGNGKYMYVAVSNVLAGDYFRSDDYGLTWNFYNGSYAIEEIRLSEDGKYVLLGTTSSPFSIYLSSNYGLTFSNVVIPSLVMPSGFTMSSRGKTIIISDGTGGSIYMSDNYGASWDSLRGFDSMTKNGVAMTSNGSRIFVAVLGNLFEMPGSVVFNTPVIVSTDSTSTMQLTGDELAIMSDSSKVSIVVQALGNLTDGAPTAAEITGIVGKSAYDVGKGYQVTIKDTDGSGLLYKVESDGTDWFYTVMTKAL